MDRRGFSALALSLAAHATAVAGGVWLAGSGRDGGSARVEVTMTAELIMAPVHLEAATPAAVPVRAGSPGLLLPTRAGAALAAGAVAEVLRPRGATAVALAATEPPRLAAADDAPRLGPKLSSMATAVAASAARLERGTARAAALRADAGPAGVALIAATPDQAPAIVGRVAARQPANGAADQDGAAGENVVWTPAATGNTPPRYPEIARRRGIEGVTLLVVEVREDGAAGAVRVARSSGSHLLDRAAEEAVLAWRFRLAPGAQPARGTIAVPIRFTLLD
ncbi:MAG: energy transducer TonB [Alphaproteobacteria bacterium]|nr:energy transducer TonB [Alphaproteobacteria bacterium]